MYFCVSRISLRVTLSVVEVVRELLNMSELGLTCSCSLTSPSAVSELYLSVSDAQLLRLLSLGVTGGWASWAALGG